MAKSSNFRAWLQITRIANLPTAFSNIAAGFWLSGGCSGVVAGTTFDLAAFLLISGLLYCGGMILNDAFDAERDAKNNPTRPIPRGSIGRRTAFLTGAGMLAAPAAFATFHLLVWQTHQFAVICLCLIAAIVLYNSVFKQTAFASVTMGLCRTLNILLGASLGFIYNPATRFSKFELNEPLVYFALAIGVFVAGITFFARAETKTTQSRWRLMFGGVVMLAGLTLLLVLPLLTDTRWPEIDHHIPKATQAYSVIIALVSFPIVRRLVIAVRTAEGKAVGSAIVVSLSSLIFLDAAVCFLVRPDQPIYAGMVALLIFPVIILRHFSSQT